MRSRGKSRKAGKQKSRKQGSGIKSTGADLRKQESQLPVQCNTAKPEGTKADPVVAAPKADSGLFQEGKAAFGYPEAAFAALQCGLFCFSGLFNSPFAQAGTQVAESNSNSQKPAFQKHAQVRFQSQQSPGATLAARSETEPSLSPGQAHVCVAWLYVAVIGGVAVCFCFCKKQFGELQRSRGQEGQVNRRILRLGSSSPKTRV